MPDDDTEPNLNIKAQDGGNSRAPVPSHLAGLMAERDNNGPNAPGPFNEALTQNTAPSLAIYDPADLRRAIEALTGQPEPPEFFADEVPSFEQNLTNEELLRLKRLRAIVQNPLGHVRPLLQGTPGIIERVAELKNRAPHFSCLFDLVIRSVHLAMLTGQSLRLPPILLLGEPGIGKTWAMKRLAEALRTTFELFPMNLTDGFRLRGLNTAWKGARPGRIAEAMLASTSASPLILLDELEKTPWLSRADRPFDVWHSLWEEENATSFTDDYLEIPLRCDRVLWVASANSTDDLPASVIDRLLVLSIPKPDEEQRHIIVQGIYAATRMRYADGLAERLSRDVEDVLARTNPRLAMRVLALALGYMAAADRCTLTVHDVEIALGIARGEGRLQPIGFLA